MEGGHAATATNLCNSCCVQEARVPEMFFVYIDVSCVGAEKAATMAKILLEKITQEGLL